MKRAGIFVALLLPVTLLLALGQAINGRVQAKPQLVDVGGIIATDTTWTAANSPYILTDRVTVQTGVTLTIEAGVIVQTPDTGDYLDVQGHLEAVGTAVNPILFTSMDDLESNSWDGLTISGSANLNNVIMRYARIALYMSGIGGGDVHLSDSLLEENSYYPIWVETEALHLLHLSNVTFNNNVPNRVAFETGGSGDMLTGSPILGPQPGLEGYEEINTDIPTVFSVPDGITLTLQPGTNLMMLSTVHVGGHVAASGTVADPITWQAVPESDGGVFSVIVLSTGTADFNHATLKGSPTLGIAVVGESDEPVLIENSTLEAIGDIPVLIEPPSLHRVQLNNVTFLNNAINRVLVETSGGWDAIAADVTLTAQPGLEWYEFADASSIQTYPPEFVVPEGITLTVEPGVEMRFGSGAETFVIDGRLQAIGTPTSPITFTSAADSAPGEWEGVILQGGSSQLENVVMRNGRENLLIGSLNPTAAVEISNSVISHSSQTPLGIQTDHLHQASLSNVSFANNVEGDNIVLYGANTLGGNAVLTSQPGLDAYIALGLSQPNSPAIVVPDDVTLTIDPGVEMRFLHEANTMVVDGRLQAIGTPTSPITFTSATDSAPGEWEGIILQGGSSQLENVVIRNGRESLLIGSLNPTATVQISDSVFSHSSLTPIAIQADNLHQVSLSNVTFANNVEGNNIVLYGALTLAGDVVLTDQPGLDAYVVLYGGVSANWFVVPPTNTLTINSGVTLKFNSSAGSLGLRVEGALHTVGTDAEPVILTSYADSAPGEWEGILLQGGSANLDYTIVRNSEDGILVGALDPSDNVQIANSVLQSHSNSPLAVTADTLHQLSLNNVAFSGNQNGDHIVIYENGALAGNVTLTAQPGLAGYVVFNYPITQLIVPDGIDLSLDDGAVLKFLGSNHELLVQGHLQATGTSLEPVILTSLADSAPNQWGGIVIENGTAQLEYTEVRNGEYNVVVNNTAVSTPVILQNSHIHDAWSVGLWVIDGAVTASCSRFANNGGSGVLVWDSGNPDVEIVSSSLVGNTDAGLRNESANLVNAVNNWWGDPSGPAGIGPGSGDAVLGNVLFDPWLPEDACATVTYQLYLPMVINP